MKIDKTIVIGILSRLADVYPYMLNSDGYSQLLIEIEEKILDGHLIYLYEKGLIDTQMKFISYQGVWEINSSLTRITANGLDYLASQPEE